MDKVKRLKRWISLLLVFLALIALFFAYQSDHKKTSKKKLAATSDVITTLEEKRVNAYMQVTHIKMELEQKKRQVENYFMAPKIGQTLAMPSYEMNWKGVDLEQEKDLSQLQRDLDPKSFANRDERSPQQNIESSLLDQQKMKELNDYEKAQYVKAFIENARNHGYLIKVDSNFVVIEVRKLPQWQRDPAGAPGDFDSSGSE